MGQADLELTVIMMLLTSRRESASLSSLVLFVIVETVSLCSLDWPRTAV